jgi:uncharacterized membrane protein
MQNFSNNGKSTFGLDANVVALLCYVANLCCYLGLILSIITIIQDKTNKLARFHAFQSILLSAAGIVIGIVINVLSGIAIAADSTALSMLITLIAFVFAIGMLIAVIYTAIQAYQGKVFKLPVIGDMADKWSN